MGIQATVSVSKTVFIQLHILRTILNMIDYVSSNSIKYDKLKICSENKYI